ncbi:MAG: phosphoribosyl-ATP diphosphatase [Phycisphaeraceae bacterium]|nr:MAG: phosphoribosyl-ATP diphosphatase [Phycisphaeraceae bacterium]
MIIPSIDLLGGTTVQLVGGRERALDAGDPTPIARRFALAGEIAVIDLDAAIGTGDNAHLIAPLLRVARCRVGGGVRDTATVLRWLDAGAAKVIIGTRATPEFLTELRALGVPRERLIAAVDAEYGEVVVKGWRERTGKPVESTLAELAPLVGGFLVTFVEHEGRMGGLPEERVGALVRAAGDARLTVAGGVRSADEIARLDRLGVDTQVGMALYTGAIDLGEAITAPLVSDRPDGLFPTVVCDETGVALGLAYSSRESIARAVRTGRGVYHSRRRGLWTKGESSGATQELLAVDLDCDRDALRFTVRQSGPGFCHAGTATCWGPARGLFALTSTLEHRRVSAPAGSYTARLLGDPALLGLKLAEEAGELAREVVSGDAERVVEESADVVYFTAAALARSGRSLADVADELDRRARRVSRRGGDAKPTPRTGGLP